MNLLMPLPLESELLLADYADFGAKILSNAFANVRYLNKSLSGSALFGKFKNIPAIICGAGPSLQNRLDFLKASYDKALIFAGGSALPALCDSDIDFHFGASFDPAPHYKSFSKTFPFFYQSRICKEVLSHVRGPLLYVEDNGNYPIEQVLYGAKTTFDSGWTVANFMCHLAFQLGCDPIIFVGVDLSYPNGASPKDWLLSAKWMERFAYMHPVNYINLSEGLDFQGIPKQNIYPNNLKNTKTYPLKEMVGSALSRIEPIAFTPPVIDFTSAYAKCSKLLSLRGAAFVLAEFELDDDLVVKFYLNPLWDVWKSVIKSEDPLQKILFFMRVLKPYVS